MSDPTALPFRHTNMGVTPYDGGATFRVWAPHADEVYVTGTFNDWSETAHPLSQEGDGLWATDVSGAKIGDQYKYIIINGERTLRRIDPYARDVTHSVGNAIIHDPDFDWGGQMYKPPPWNALIIYEMHIGTFNDQPGGPPGNLDKAIEKLPYLRDLGINAVEVLPPMEFAGDFSWGYNPSHIFAIESAYGGSQAFKTFIKAAHAHGIAVIFDVVYNHFGPSDLDLWQFDGWSKNDKGGIYFYNGWRSKTPWGDTRPNYDRAEVRQYMRDNALMWLEAYHCDGLRWDATAYIRNVYGHNNDFANDIADGWRFMQWVNDERRQTAPQTISIAEDLRDNPWITKDTSAGGLGFDTQWDRIFVHAVREALITIKDEDRDMLAVRDAIQYRYNANALERVIYTESHDEVANGKARVPEEIWPDNADSWFSKKRSTLGAVLVFTTPGIPMIFQGQEILEDDWFHDEDPIDWSKKEQFAGILQLYRDLIHLRRNMKERTRGLCGQHVNVHHVNQEDKVIAFHRWADGGPGDSVVVVVNMANRCYTDYNLGFPREGLWKVRFNSDWRGYDPEFDDHPSYDTVAHWGPKDDMLCNANVSIGPYSAIILSQD